MLLKIIGSIMIISASVFIGNIFSRDCARRPQELRILQGLLQIFENEISFLSSILTDAFEKVYKSSNCCVTGFFISTVKYLKSEKCLNAVHAWEMAVRENIKKTALNKEDEEILISFGVILGSSDLEGQIKNIRLTLNQLKIQEDKAEDIRRKNEKMYSNLGLLGGLAVVIILF